MAKLIIANKENRIKYTDGSKFEKKMLNFSKNNKIKLNKQEKWPFTYHFSKYREGILNWYPFKENCTILEIGSGCGAITGLLCNKAKRVVSVELEYNRAEINYERNKKFKNLEIIVSDVNKLNLKDKFDYVILNGVLEYAQYILDSKSDKAYSDLLVKSKSFLKNDGTMLLAIENRLGVKYIAGYKEDHLGSIYSGLNGYIGSNIKTFSKQELADLLKSASCKITKWYYPWPDYKFPFEIFTDKSINKIYPTMLSLPLDLDQIELIDSDLLYRSFMNNNIMQNFANSFLIEINKESSNNIDYVKLSTIRKDEFSIITTINYSKNKVYKKNIYKCGLRHIQNISKNNYKNEILNTIEYKYTENRCECNIIKGSTLLDEVLKDKSKFIPILDNLYTSLINNKPTIKKPCKNFIKVFGDVELNTPLHWIKGVNIDISLDNIYRSNNKLLVIDPEWQFDFYIPAEFILWRIIFNLPQNGLCDRNMIKNSMKHFNISSKLCDTFKKMEINFVFNYVGYKPLPYKKLTKINVNEIINKKG